MHGEPVWFKDKEKMPEFLNRFCTMALPYLFLSQHDRLAMIDDVLYYAGCVVAGEFAGMKMIRQDDYVLREDDNLFVKVTWREREIIAYSKEGYHQKSWKMPGDWQGITEVDLYRITLEGLEVVKRGAVIQNGMLTLSLESDQAVSIVPKGTDVSV
jgi:hypothetical protein